MAKYLVRGNYIGKGFKGLLREGGSNRRSVIEKLAGSLGGKVECIYYAFGEFDIYFIMDMPDNASMAAFSLKISASGLARVSCVTLLTVDEIDVAVAKTAEYRPPGTNWLP
jgi:uncharacterized protein with GYD domain